MARTRVLNQDVLIPGFTDSAFLGAPVTAHNDAERIVGQQSRVESIMAGGYWHTIPNLQRELKRRFNALYSETSISARIRASRKRDWVVECRRTRPGSGLYEYRATKKAITVTVHDFPAEATAKEQIEAAMPIISRFIRDTTIVVDMSKPIMASAAEIAELTAPFIASEAECEELASVSDALPSTADLDATAEESAIAAATSTNGVAA